MHIKRFVTLLFLLIHVLPTPLSASIARATGRKSVLPILHWTTKSGVPVYFVEKSEIPVIDVGIVFHAGSAYDGSSPGIAYFTALMLNQGTYHFGVEQIATRFESAGARYSVTINRDQAILQLRFLSKPQFFNSAINTFADVISHANFPETAVNRTKKQIGIALQQEQQLPGALAHNALYSALYGQHPYASPLLGTQHSIEQITNTTLINFHQRYYVAKNAVIAIVGNVTRDKAIILAEQLVSALPLGEKAAPIPPPTPQCIAHHRQIYYPSQQTTILLGQIGITLKNPDYFPLTVGNQILGGGTLTSRLFAEVRNKRGLCYSITSHFSTLQAAGPFVISLQTRRSQAQQALSITQDTLKNFILRGPTDAELMAAKQALVGGFPLSIANNAAILATLENIGFYELPLTYLDSYCDHLMEVRAAQTHKALQKYIRPSKLILVTVGKNQPDSDRQP